jgi:PAS domain S-box-containing protein
MGFMLWSNNKVLVFNSYNSESSSFFDQVASVKSVFDIINIYVDFESIDNNWFANRKNIEFYTQELEYKSLNKRSFTKFNQTIDFESSIKLIKENLNASFFHLWHYCIGKYTLEGYLISHYKQGIAVATKAINMFSWINPGDVKVQGISLGTYMYFFQELIKCNIKHIQLPPFSRNTSLPESYFHIYHKEVIFLSVIYILQTCLIIFLIINIHKRKKTQQKLSLLISQYEQLNSKYEKINTELKDKNNNLLIAEEKLRENIIKIENQKNVQENINKNFEEVIRAAQIGTFERDVASDKVIRNSVAAEMIGMNVEDLGETNEKWLSLIHPEDIESTKVGCALDKKVNNTSFDISYRIKHKKGHWVWLQCKGKVTEYDENNYPKKIKGVTMDITRQKEIEIALQRSEEQFRLLSEYSIEGILIQDKGHIVNVNFAFAKFLGFKDPESLIGSNIPIKTIVSKYIPEFESMVATNFVGIKEIQVKLKNDQLIDLELKGYNINYQGKDINLLAARDISERKYHINLARCRMEIMNKAYDGTLDDIVQEAIDKIEGITNSKIGFFHFIEGDNLFLSSWSTNTSELFCHVEGVQMHYPVSKAGVWADCIRKKKTIIHNDFEKVKNTKGMPEGHNPIRRELLVPVVRNQQVVAAVGVGNKENKYTHQDVKVAEQLADLTWDIIDKKRTEQNLAESEMRFKTIFKKSKVVMLLIDPKNGNIINANDTAHKFYGYTKEEFTTLSIYNLNTLNPDKINEKLTVTKNHKGNCFRFKHKLKSGEIRDVDLYSSPIKVSNRELLHAIIIDVTKAVEAEYEIKQVNKRFKGLDNIIHYPARSINDLLDFTLQQVIEYTESDMGAIYHYNSEKDIFYLNNWSDDLKLTFSAQTEDVDIQQLDCLTQTVNSKKPVIINKPTKAYAFQNDEIHKKELFKSISIPIISNHKITAVLWLSSKTKEYSCFHAEQVMLLLDTTWILVERQRMRDEIH